MTRYEEAARVCAELGGKPMTSADLSKVNGLSLKSCVTDMSRAAAKGLLHLHKTQRGLRVYAFASREAFEAFGEAALETMADVAVKARLKVACKASNMARFGVATTKPSKPATVTLKGRASDMRGPVDYSKAKWIRDTAPRPTARWQTLPDSGESIFAGHPGYGRKA